MGDLLIFWDGVVMKFACMLFILLLTFIFLCILYEVKAAQPDATLLLVLIL